MAAAESKKPRRDVRVDRIGFVGELVKNYIEGDGGVKAKVKAAMKAGDVVAGDFFEGRLDACVEREIGASSVLKLYADHKISRAQLLEILRVNVGQAEKILDQATFARLVSTCPGEPRLVVSRQKGVQIELRDALVGLQAAITGDDAGGKKAVA